MKTYTASVKWLVCLLVGLAGTCSIASDGTRLSTSDEKAYQSALAAWKQIEETHKEAGIPTPGDPPKREDFIDYSAQRADAAAWDTAARIEAEARWNIRVDEAQPYMRMLRRRDATYRRDLRAETSRSEKDRLMQAADEKWAQRHESSRYLDDLANRLGVERRRETADGRYAILAGEINGEPIWVSSQSQIAAASIAAHELWPTNTVSWPSSRTGLDLTGEGIILGVWEVEGAVRTTHYEFQGRVLQIDGSTQLDSHATSVAGAMAGGGMINFPILGNTDTHMRGVAFQSDIDAYDIDEFSAEIYDATAGTTNDAGLRLSNHSWGFRTGWRQESFHYRVITNIADVTVGVLTNIVNPTNGLPTNVVAVSNGWVWQGPVNLGYFKDPKFGAYIVDFTEGYGCAQLDTLLSAYATRHLMVYAAGNERFNGPQVPTNYYAYSGSNVFVFNNPGQYERAWRSGDGSTYGFNTVVAPGTAKNVLTVGSVRDVFHVVGSQTNWGYSSNAVVSLSSFSGTGPTDDGRIKPDIVAVGEANPLARNYPFVAPGAGSDFQALGFPAGGTSFAAPGVTAGLGLALQRRYQLFPSMDEEIDALRGSTLKALAIHTADYIGNPGPRYLTGWGLFNAASAALHVDLDAANGRGTHIKEIHLDVGQTNSWLVYLDGSPFKATAVWSDLPGIPPAGQPIDPVTPMLVNNLDLWVETVDGSQQFMPWILNPDLTNKNENVRAEPATTGYDDRNNVEQVFIEAPAAGVYRIYAVHAGGLPGGQTPTSQWLSILTSGDTPIPPNIAHFAKAPSSNEVLIEFVCDPGAFLILETSTDLMSQDSWQEEGLLVTESSTNAIIFNPNEDVLFWRLRRQTGE